VTLAADVEFGERFMRGVRSIVSWKMPLSGIFSVAIDLIVEGSWVVEPGRGASVFNPII